MDVLTRNRDETLALARALGEKLSPAIILLEGEMGAGKTAFSKAFAEGAGSHDDTGSPTYAIVSEYEGDRGPIYHFDLYRIEDLDELYAVGFDDYLDQDAATLLVEWPDVAELEDDPALKNRIVKIELTPEGDGRRLSISGTEDREEEIRQILKERRMD